MDNVFYINILHKVIIYYSKKPVCNSVLYTSKLRDVYMPSKFYYYLLKT